MPNASSVDQIPCRWRHRWRRRRGNLSRLHPSIVQFMQSFELHLAPCRVPRRMARPRNDRFLEHHESPLLRTVRPPQPSFAAPSSSNIRPQRRRRLARRQPPQLHQPSHLRRHTPRPRPRHIHRRTRGRGGALHRGPDDPAAWVISWDETDRATLTPTPSELPVGGYVSHWVPGGPEPTGDLCQDDTCRDPSQGGHALQRQMMILITVPPIVFFRVVAGCGLCCFFENQNKAKRRAAREQQALREQHAQTSL